MEKGNFSEKGDQLYQQAEKTIKGKIRIKRVVLNIVRWVFQEPNELEV